MGETVGMARETKVGLLAGLAFIICFAVILSNRGRTELVPANHSMIPERVDRVQSPGGLNTPLGSSPSGIALNERFFSPAQDSFQTMTEKVPPGQATPSSDTQRKLEERLARLEETAGLASIGDPTKTLVTNSPTEALKNGMPPVGQPTPPTQKPAPPTYMEYTVKPGDTLWRIAQTQCGSGAKSVIDTILELNRDRIAKANHVQSGVVLRLPRVVEHKSGTSVQRAALPESPHAKPDLNVKAASDSTSKPLPGKKSESLAANTPGPTGKAGVPDSGQKPRTADQGFRWYQVRKNDRYASIARDVLGDGDRWDEIYAMNKDKFPDPNRIREGVRIKVPVRK